MTLMEFLHTSPLGPAVRSGRSRILLPFWILRGRPMPLPPHLKTRRIANIATHFRADLFIETGTYRGDTSLHLSKRVSKVITVEIDKRLADLARQRLAGFGVDVLTGDSAELMPAIVGALSNERVLYWLDGHFSAGVTGGNFDSLPLSKELAVIVPSLKDWDLILVDDVREFGRNGYPSLELLHQYAMGLNPKVVMHSHDDMAFIGLENVVDETLRLLSRSQG